MLDLPLFKEVQWTSPYIFKVFLSLSLSPLHVHRNSLKAMEDVKLSLSTNFSDTSNNSVINSCKKRKYFTWDHHLPISQASIELDPVDPLPLHWEQCLDLQSGRMYYLNRKTLRKSWSKPKEQKLDLELNISSGFSSSKKREEEYCCYSWNKLSDSMSSNANMVAVACANCHLLVMLCKSSPSCPNCKYMHYSLPMYHATKPLKTLSLLH